MSLSVAPAWLLLLALPLAAQDALPLHLVTRLDCRVPRVVAADVSVDGETVVTLDDRRTVVAYGVNPWRERKRFSIAGKADLDDIRISADGTQVALLMAAWESAPTATYSLVDGTPVQGVPAPIAPLDNTPPPGLASRLDAQPTHLRAAGDHRTVMLRHHGTIGVCRDRILRWLSDSPLVCDFAVTGNGNHVVIARPTGVEVQTVSSGEVWRLPLGFAPNVAVTTVGFGSRFVCVDREFAVVGDAERKCELLRVPLSRFGLHWSSVQLVAAAEDALQLAVTALDSDDSGPRTWQVDLVTGAVLALPIARQQILRGEGGWLLLDGKRSRCGVVIDPRWSWNPQQGGRSEWTPEMVYANGTVIPERRELVYQAEADRVKSFIGELRRCDALDGTLRAAAPLPEPWINGIAYLAGHVIDTTSGPEGGVLELRRVEDLEVVATATLPACAFGSVELRTAARAPRIAVHASDSIEIYDVKLPGTAGK